MDSRMKKTERVDRERATIIHVVYWLLILFVCLLSYQYLLPVLIPFVLAFLIAWMMNFPITYLHAKLRIPRVVSAATLTVLFSVTVFGISALCGSGVASGLKSIAEKLPSIFTLDILPGLEYLFSWIENLVVSIDPVIGAALETTIDSLFNILSNGVLQICSNILSVLGSIVVSLPSVFMKTIITFIATVFIATDFETIRNFLTKLIPENRRIILREFRRFFGKTVPKCIFSYVLIFTVTFLELWIGFWLLHIQGGALLALIVAMLDILPVLGTGTILIPWAVIAIIQGNIAFGCKLLLLYLIITVIRNMLEPRLVGHLMHLHPVITFASMLTGIHFFGIVGLFGVPLGIAFLQHLHRNGVICISILESENKENE